jgi:hypothetical protein
MKLVFTCALKEWVFRSDEYRVIEHRGVSVDAAGRKRLDMQVQLSTPCPFCGELHIYAADELACPLTGNLARQ